MSRKEKKRRTIKKYRIKNRYSCPYGKIIPSVIEVNRSIFFIIKSEFEIQT